MVSKDSNGEPQTPKDSQVKETVPVKAPWVNLFKDNRKPDEGTKLQTIDDLPEIVALEEDDVHEVEDAWGFSLVGYVAGRFPGKTALLQLCNSWKVNYKYSVHTSGWLIFKFENAEDRLNVLEGRPYFVFGRPLMLKIMPQFFEFDDKEISTVPIWINLPGLPLECWKSKALSKIVSKVGKPISTDKLTSTMDRISYVRVLVEVDVSKELVRTVHMMLPNGKLREQGVYFEHVPKYCNTCKMFGHPTLGCNVNRQHADGKGVESGSKQVGTKIGQVSGNTKEPTAQSNPADQNGSDIGADKTGMRKSGENSETQQREQDDEVQNQFNVVDRNKNRNNQKRQKNARQETRPLNGLKAASNEKLKGKLDESHLAVAKKDKTKGNVLRISS
ncbi:uncharacterized protein LOC111366827 [Olea europaea var. sylvestris]|uniref:uncharacterized protein LOC111366827 n=1 Tax=Olea europaea var. sylvestris TaxID=158386 RepID=UPI000C1D57C6|nr:uncharacterized protein LOC111366827 [Olea europaea var. sylvestris]